MHRIKNIIQSLMMIYWIRRFTHYGFFFLYFLFSKLFILPVVFFCMVPAFWREQRAVLSGFSDYFKNNLAPHQNISLLRRNIHRVEKALVMRPLRDRFALGYIEETVTFIEYVTANSEPRILFANRDTLGWSVSVLDKYFATIVLNPKLESLEARYRKTRESLAEFINPTDTPIPRKDYPDVNVSYEDFNRLAITRRSVRWYLDTPVPRELVEKALETAIQAPSACNRMPYEFRIFDDPDLVQKVASLPMGTIGYSKNIQTIAVVVGKLNAYFSARDRHLIYIDGSLAAMSLMLACETLGLSTCPINWPDFEPLEQKMAKLLNLMPYERPLMLVSIGYADPEGLIPSSAKKQRENYLRWN